MQSFFQPQGFKGESSSSGEEEIQPLAVVSSSLLLLSLQEGAKMASFLAFMLLFFVVLYSMLCGCRLQDVGNSLTCVTIADLVSGVVLIMQTL